jgi:NAD(P)-dependent dehydrogenase (short-subunit alcohol dehydrogenase family)
VLRGQVAVVTGASSGLGRELALALGARGARLVLAARSEAGLSETASRMPPGASDPLILPGDLTDPDRCRELVRQTVTRFGQLDHLVLAAGLGMWARFEEISDLTMFQRLMSVNYLSAVYCTHAALPHLRRTRGLITVISSLQGELGVPLHTGYAGAKHALHGFFDSLRLELGDGAPGILVVLPSWIGGTSLRASALGPDGTPVRHARTHRSTPLSAPGAAGRIVGAMESRAKELVLPARMRCLLWLNRIAPGLAAVIVQRRMRREDRGT